MPSKVATGTIFNVFGMTWPRIEPTTSRFLKRTHFAIGTGTIPFHIPFHDPFYIPFHVPRESARYSILHTPRKEYSVPCFIPFFIPFHVPFCVPVRVLETTQGRNDPDSEGTGTRKTRFATSFSGCKINHEV